MRASSVSVASPVAISPSHPPPPAPHTLPLAFPQAHRALRFTGQQEPCLGSKEAHNWFRTQCWGVKAWERDRQGIVGKL